MERGMDMGVERSRPAVLLVEDDPSLGDILGKNLEARGYRVDRAETLAQALASLAGEAPGVMLLDVNLPDGSGWDVLRALEAAGPPGAHGGALGGAGEPFPAGRVPPGGLPAQAVPAGGPAGHGGAPHAHPPPAVAD